MATLIARYCRRCQMHLSRTFPYEATEAAVALQDRPGRHALRQTAHRASVESPTCKPDVTPAKASPGYCHAMAARAYARSFYAIRYGRKEGLLKRVVYSSLFYRLLGRVSRIAMPADAGNFGLVDRRVACEIAQLMDRDRYYAGLRSWVRLQAGRGPGRARAPLRRAAPRLDEGLVAAGQERRSSPSPPMPHDALLRDRVRMSMAVIRRACAGCCWIYTSRGAE